MSMKAYRLARKKGFTLVELVLAIAITAILVSNVGYLILSSVRVRQKAQTNEELLQVSLRLHNALSGELQTAAYATVYESKFGTPDVERLIYCQDGQLWIQYYQVNKDKPEDKNEIVRKFLPENFQKATDKEIQEGKGLFYKNGEQYKEATETIIAAGSHELYVETFNYYDGAILKDEPKEGSPAVIVNPAFRIRLVAIQDYNIVSKQADLDTVPSYYRCVEITTTLFKNDRYYTHKSTIRLDELSMYTYITNTYKGEVKVGTSRTESHTAIGSDAVKNFQCISYSNKPY